MTCWGCVLVGTGLQPSHTSQVVVTLPRRMNHFVCHPGADGGLSVGSSALKRLRTAAVLHGLQWF